MSCRLPMKTPISMTTSLKQINVANRLYFLLVSLHSSFGFFMFTAELLIIHPVIIIDTQTGDAMGDFNF